MFGHRVPRLCRLFLAGLSAGTAEKHPVLVAGEAVSKRVYGASAVAPRAVSDVVTKALAFRAMLTTTHQQTLEQAYTASLARRWSNLPCASTCRNGIGLGTLTADQLAAALEVIRAVESAVANEGFDEFQQIRMADDVLAAQGGEVALAVEVMALDFTISHS